VHLRTLIEQVFGFSSEKVHLKTRLPGVKDDSGAGVRALDALSTPVAWCLGYQMVKILKDVSSVEGFARGTFNATFGTFSKHFQVKKYPLQTLPLCPQLFVFPTPDTPDAKYVVSTMHPKP
jgi:hypothetical protein